MQIFQIYLYTNRYILLKHLITYEVIIKKNNKQISKQTENPEYIINNYNFKFSFIRIIMYMFMCVGVEN